MTKTEIRDLLLKAAWEGRANSYSPYSGFAVGAAVLGTDGRVYRGCNIENASYGLTVCGERTAVFNMVSSGCPAFTAMAVVGGEHSSSAPCGACRQVLAEFCRDPGAPVYVSGSDGDIIETTVGELLPIPFLKEHLGK